MRTIPTADAIRNSPGGAVDSAGGEDFDSDGRDGDSEMTATATATAAAMAKATAKAIKKATRGE